MPNSNLFNTRSTPPRADTRNQAGGRAYSMTSKLALAQLACTGTFNSTYYASAKSQLDEVLKLARACDPEWVARVAVYARTAGLMKDAPVLLVAHLFSLEDKTWFNRAFPQVINNIGQLRSFVQMVRSNVTGRKSLGSAGKRAIANMLNSMNGNRIFWQAVGTSPSLGDVLKLAHVRPSDAEHDALYAYFIDREYDFGSLPSQVQDFERFKAGDTQEVPRAPFLRLTSLDLSTAQWGEVARTMTWNQLRLNINNLARKGVFNDRELSRYVAETIKNPELVARSRALPFALYSTYKNLDSAVPQNIQNAVSAALTLSVKNAPVLPGRTLVAVDSSGSMSSGITGNRGRATTTMSCVEAASYFAAALLKTNPDNVDIIAYDTSVKVPRLNPEDSVATIMRSIGTRGGGTDTSKALEYAARDGGYDNVIIVSDNQSWIGRNMWGGGATRCAEIWQSYTRRRRGAKLVCIDIQPYTNTQNPDSSSVLNVGGISDAVFKVASAFVESRGQQHWDNVLGAVEL